ncbi:unnamed protein product [Sympodiomycopsis kandeliae]
MAPGSASRPAKLDLSSVMAADQNRPRANSTATPSSITFVVSGSAGVKRVDDLVQKWKESGFLTQSNIQLKALAYEADPKDDSDFTPDLFKSASTAPTNMPLTLILPLPTSLGQKLPPQIPQPKAPAHTSLNFALPTINKAADLKSTEQDWLQFFQKADEHRYSIELALRSPAHNAKDEDLEAIRGHLEELLGKAHAEAAKNLPQEESGGFFVIDSFAGPPLHLPSSQLSRSQEFADWASFVGRLALHPRTYIKLSPFTLSALTDSASSILSATRAADAPTATAVPSSVSSTAQAAKEAAVSAISGAEKTVHTAASALTGSGDKSASEERAAELKRRLRIFLDVIVEAFGLERLIWSANLSAGQLLGGDAAKDGVSNALSGSADEEAVKDWYNAVQQSLTNMGLDGPAVEGIFSNNASKVYRL